MQGRRELRCLIAAGGTAGHVLPSLAVAEALSGRGVRVTFAGSPDRVEARLVPERGFAFDAFRIAGLPRRPGAALARALLLAGRAPVACARIFSFVNPWHDAQGAGFQTVQAMIGLGSGGLFGVGLGQSVQKANYLPEAHTDMIFAIIGEELGLVGAAAVIAAYATFAYVGLRIALRCRDPFGKRLAAGLTVLVCGQAAINLSAVMGLAPLTGIPLPFVSYGGSSLISNFVLLALLVRVSSGPAPGRARALA